MTIAEVMAEIAPKLACGSIRLCLCPQPGRPNLEPDQPNIPPSVTIGVVGGHKALAQATDEDILLLMRNATDIAALLRRELPPHWEVYQ